MASSLDDPSIDLFSIRLRNSMLMHRSNLRQMLADCYHVSFERETMITDEEAPEEKMTEICIENIGLCAPSSSSAPAERPFKLLVKNQVFTIDSEKLGRLSPIFALMCFGRDFENGREMIREVVDEKCEDIAEFLRCVHDHSLINEWNLATLLRLSTKYQVSSLSTACGDFVLKSNLDNVKPDQVLTMLIASNDFHQPLPVIKRLILRLAREEKLTYTRLKINRFLPTHLYTALISANLNLAYLKEVEGMNGHLFRVDHNKTVFKRAFCTYCKQRIVDVAECEGCRQCICKEHLAVKPCTNEYGGRMLHELRQNIVEINAEE